MIDRFASLGDKFKESVAVMSLGVVLDLGKQSYKKPGDKRLLLLWAGEMQEEEEEDQNLLQLQTHRRF
jgi:hypothetical protein